MLPFNLKGREEAKKTALFFLITKVTQEGGAWLSLGWRQMCVGLSGSLVGRAPEICLPGRQRNQPLGKDSNLRQGIFSRGQPRHDTSDQGEALSP